MKRVTKATVNKAKVKPKLAPNDLCFQLSAYEGKYVFRFYQNGEIELLRAGEIWNPRGATFKFERMMLALAQENKALKKLLKACRAETDDHETYEAALEECNGIEAD